ncbi:MAG: Uncharacterized protein CEN89_618 [Candidatus Berkelbacteria bacterium Licking1014_7]|uniref:Predicted membrane protein YciQ-like C-terminal domain-containing protein n=1 Tax=Candidatus Berkelbacteria bacterium Licking1014_7 TaxID=2017147 RepID=A0A554LI72_9BACT|nr:MAG: Uncharacterized protein CEN89_618 [Candidatus Berkelbacteria bacterium Licking1014_7]
MLLISFRRKHFVFWIVLIAVFFVGKVSLQKITADYFTNDSTGWQSTGQDYYNLIKFDTQAKVLWGDKDISRALIPGVGKALSDEFFYVLIENPGVEYRQMKIEVVLPETMEANLVEVKPIFSYTSEPVAQVKAAGNKIVITGSNLDSQTLFSLKLLLPKGYIHFPWQKIVWQVVKNQKANVWLGFSLILPFMVMISYVAVALKWRSSHKRAQNKNIIDVLPGDISPSVLDILYHGKITSRSISATILDLANQGVLEIVFKNGGFEFGRFGAESKKITGKLKLNLAQKAILSKIFTEEKLIARDDEVRFRLAHRLFSKKIALFYYLIYNEAKERGFFVQDPVLIHWHYKSWGMVIFFLSIIGLILGLYIMPGANVLLWLGAMFSGVLFIKLSSKISFLSGRGENELKKWLAFRNYLCNANQLSDYKDKHLLIKYLPYSVAMDCESEWVARFQNQQIVVPDWYVNVDSNQTVADDFSNNLLVMLDWLSRSLFEIKDPAVE